MKRYGNLALAYGIAALVAGVYYREITRSLGFTGRSALSVVHLHLFALGTLFCLVLALLDDRFEISAEQGYAPAFRLYNGGLIFMCLMFLVKGTIIVLGQGTGGFITTILLGLSHAIFGAGLLWFLIVIRKGIAAQESPLDRN